MARGKIHYGWWILASICALNVTSFALTTSLSGVFLLPVSSALGVSRSTLAFWMTIHSICSVLTLPLWGHLLKSDRINVVMSTAVLVMVVALLIFAFANNVWMFYLGGAMIGFAMPPISCLGFTTLVSNWFADGKRGRLLGIGVACSGLASFVWAPTFTAIISSFGHRVAYVVAACLMGAIALPFTAKVVKRSPEDMGLLPLGYDPSMPMGNAASLSDGVSARRVFRTWPFYTLLFVYATFALGMGFQANQVGFATEFLSGSVLESQSAMIGATMISTAAVADIISKVTFGVLLDKIGFKKTSAIFVTTFFLCFVVWATFHNVAGLYVGAFLLGTHTSFLQVGLPLLVRDIYGPKDYSVIHSYIMVAKLLFAGSGASLVALFYDLAGSYQGAMFGGMGLVLVCGVLIFVTIRAVGKIPWDGDARGKTDVA